MNKPGPTHPIQTWVQINVYRDNGGQYEFLLLKRIDEDDKFWQVVTEKVPTHGTIPETLRQAALNQIGVRGFKHLSKEMFSYEWYTRGDHGRDIVFAVELGATTAVKPDSHLYSEYAWLNYDEALLRLKWDGNKQALRQLAAHLHKQRLDTPLPQRDTSVGFYHSASDSKPVHGGKVGGHDDVQQAEDSQIKFRSTNPYGGNVPRRLPDERLPDRPDEDEDPNTIFLRL